MHEIRVSSDYGGRNREKGPTTMLQRYYCTRHYSFKFVQVMLKKETEKSGGTDSPINDGIYIFLCQDHLIYFINNS